MVRAGSPLTAVLSCCRERRILASACRFTNARSPHQWNIANALSSDYINPIDLCNRLNTYIIPEAAVHAVLTFLFLINGYWIALILNLPLLAWNAKK